MASPRKPLRLFHDVLDVVLEDEQVRFAFTGEANEGVIVILDDTDDFLAAGHLHAHRRAVLNQLLEILRLLEGLFRRTRGFA